MNVKKTKVRRAFLDSIKASGELEVVSDLLLAHPERNEHGVLCKYIGQDSYTIVVDDGDMTAFPITTDFANEFMSSPAYILRATREKYNLSRNDIVELLHIPFNTYSNWERGERVPNNWVLEMILELLELKVGATNKSEEKEVESRYILHWEDPTTGKVLQEDVYSTLSEAEESKSFLITLGGLEESIQIRYVTKDDLNSEEWNDYNKYSIVK